MEPFGAFATIVGLICNFKSEGRAATEDEYSTFLEWLSQKRHKELIQELNSNHMLGISIKNLLNQNNEKVLEKLSILDKSMLELASMIGGLKEIADAYPNKELLSSQAMSVLEQFVDSEGSTVLESKTLEGTFYYVIDGERNKSSITVSEKRFMNDDLDKLCSLGLLKLDYNRSGDRLFRITRAALSMVNESK